MEIAASIRADEHIDLPERQAKIAHGAITRDLQLVDSHAGIVPPGSFIMFLTGERLWRIPESGFHPESLKIVRTGKNAEARRSWR